MHVRVDDARQHEQSRGIDLLARGRPVETRNPPVRDADLGPRLCAAHEEIVFRHSLGLALILGTGSGLLATGQPKASDRPRKR